MRTTLNLDEAVMRAVKREALRSGRTMTDVIESSLRETLLQRKPTSRERFRLKMVTAKGALNAGVDLTDRDNLFDVMEGRR